jgi:2-(1,2-epoxy-1,2-dihydrophenyl)acetyl-CoA isomerase
LLAQPLSAEKALDWGLINRVEDDADLMEKAMEMAETLARGPRSIGLIRQLYWAGLDNTYAGQLDLEAKLQSQAGVSRDFQEGVAAFREKRPARFTGQ